MRQADARGVGDGGSLAPAGTYGCTARCAAVLAVGNGHHRRDVLKVGARRVQGTVSEGLLDYVERCLACTRCPLPREPCCQAHAHGVRLSAL
jgi:hypothetical protein